MIHQTMSLSSVQHEVKKQTIVFAIRINSGELTLESAHSMLTNTDSYKLDLFQIAGLAQSIACFQCSKVEE